MKIGDKLWAFDENRRVHRKDGTLIYREQFYEVRVIRETPRSWVIGWALIIDDMELFKVPKSDPFCDSPRHPGDRRRLFTWGMKEDECWANENRVKIVMAVRRVNGALLRKVAASLGYKG